MTKRYLRIAPPYIAAVLIALMLWFAGSQVPSFHGQMFRIEPNRLVAHLFFANDILGLAWFNPVFWTLAIEFQYYIAMAILFPLLFSRTQLCNVLAVTALMVASWLPGREFLVSNWVLIFLAGIVMAQWQLQCLSRTTAAVLIISILSLILWHHGTTIFVATLLTLALVIWPNGMSRLGIVLGQLSYSLYLMHVPVGGRVVNLGMRYVRNDLDRWCVLSLAFAASFAAAWLLWITVERSALKWSSRIKYRTLRGAS
jgi:peptidoglycan/LPS O-acetylase OafA/YrhL